MMVYFMARLGMVDGTYRHLFSPKLPRHPQSLKQVPVGASVGALCVPPGSNDSLTDTKGSWAPDCLNCHIDASTPISSITLRGRRVHVAVD